MQSQEIQRLRANINRRKLWDYIFIIVAILSLFVGILTLIALVLQLAIAGIPRVNWAFFTSFADPEPDLAGILTAWVGSCLVMLVTIVMTVPVGD